MHHPGSIPQKYQHKVRIGNWSEEWELEKIRYIDFINSKTNTQIQHEKVQFANQKASLTYSKSGYINFGDKIMVFNDYTNGYLACDIWDKVQLVDEAYGVSTTQKTFPNIRSVFQIIPCEEDLYMYGSLALHYGQKFRLLANPRIYKKSLYLSSQQADPQISKKNTRQQDAYICSKNNFNTVWIVEHVDPQIRYEMNKQPISANQPVVIKHFQTNQYLASDNNLQKNTFGNENDVFVHQFLTHNKTQNLVAEKMGRTTIDIPLRDQLNQNVWVLVTADDPALEFDENEDLQIRSGKDVANKIRKLLIAKSFFSIRGLDLMCQIIDEYNQGTLDQDNFRWALRNVGIILSYDDLNMLYQYYDKNNNGNISYKDFLIDLRGQICEKRLGVIQKAYQKLQQQYSTVNLESIGRAYQAELHPYVLKGVKNVKQHFDEFVKDWNIKDYDQVISQNQFIEYFIDVSALIERTEHFEQLIKDTFQL